MTQRSENLQPSLFEAERLCVELRAAQKSELATVAIVGQLHAIALPLLSGSKISRTSGVGARQRVRYVSRKAHQTNRCPYQILFQVTPLETPYLRQTLSCLGRTQTGAALPVRRGLPLSIVDSAGSSHETAGLEDLCAKRSGNGSWPDRLSWHDSDNHRAWFRPKDRPGWGPLQGPMAVGLRSPADFRRPSDRRCRSPRVFAVANCL